MKRTWLVVVGWCLSFSYLNAEHKAVQKPDQLPFVLCGLYIEFEEAQRPTSALYVTNVHFDTYLGSLTALLAVGMHSCVY